MPIFRRAEVTSVLVERPGLQRLGLRMADGSDARAFVLTDLTGSCAPGDPVIVNTTAVELGLGTGGWHVVHWNLVRDEFVAPGPDHVMKLRYTSLQSDVGTDELSHPEVDRPLDGAPVVACTLHSQVAMVALAFADAAPGRRLAYVMTDGAALPVALSDVVADLRSRGVLAGVVTAGHAFGGDLEAVTVPAGLGLARHVLDADAIVVGMGPGVVGTGTSLGTTAIEVAPILDSVARLGGTPILCIRASDADARPRHRGISHHTRTILRLTSTEPWVAPIPPEVAGLEGVRVLDVDPPRPADLLAGAGMTLTTMGRDVTEDPVFFQAAAAAGSLAAALLASDPLSERP